MSKPKIRFKGYEEDWEQRKLGEIADLTSSKRVHAQDYVDSGVPFYRGKEISELREHKPVSEVLYITEEKYKEMAKLYGSPQVGDLLITAVGTIGNTWVVDNVPFYFKDGNLIWFKNIKCNPNYLDYVLSSDDGQKKIDVSAIGSNQKALTMVKLTELKFMFPNDDEQVKIADYFCSLDHLITLHQRKCEETKKLKKYMLQKMFPQNGKRVPEIRFAGFTDDWEQRKLGDLFNEYSEKNHPELPALTIIQGGGTIKRKNSDRNLMYNKSNLSNYKMVRKNDFIVHLRSFEGGLERSSLDGIISPAYHTFHGEEVDSRFYYLYFRSYEFIKHKLVPHVYGIRDGRSIDIEGMKTIKIPYTSLKEQRAIGDYLDSLDHLITLHQRKYEELQKIKKFMLQNMFI